MTMSVTLLFIKCSTCCRLMVHTAYHFSGKSATCKSKVLNMLTKDVHRTFPRVATCGFCPRFMLARPLDARKTHQVFLRGRKNDVVQRGKREPTVWSKAHSARRTRCGFSREPERPTHRNHVPHPAHSAPKPLRLLRIACPRPPQAGYARNVQSSTKNKKLSAEFARSANNSNKIPPGGVYVGRD